MIVRFHRLKRKFWELFLPHVRITAAKAEQAPPVGHARPVEQEMMRAASDQ